MTQFNFNDGGRKDAGYKGSTGDCVCRSICIASSLPYQQVYNDLANGNRDQRLSKHQLTKIKLAGKHGGKYLRNKMKTKTAGQGINTNRKWFKEYMESIGFKWTPTMLIGQGCKVHLQADELPKGRLVVAVSKHYTAVIDGVIHDTHDPSERGVTIYPNGYPGELPKGAYKMENGNGYAYKPERCVYGYWELKINIV